MHMSERARIKKRGNMRVERASERGGREQNHMREQKNIAKEKKQKATTKYRPLPTSFGSGLYLHIFLKRQISRYAFKVKFMY